MAASVNSHWVLCQANGSDPVNVHLRDGVLHRSILVSQFPGATGLRYMIENAQMAIAYDAINDSFLAPEGGWASRTYTVVSSATTGTVVDQPKQSGVIEHARSALGNTTQLAREVARTFSDDRRECSVTGPPLSFNPRRAAVYSSHRKGKTSREMARNKEKLVLSKSYKVVFIVDCDIPVIYSKDIVIAESQIDFTIEDREIAIRSKLRDVIKCCQFQHFPVASLTPKDFIFLGSSNRMLSEPMIPPGYELNGKRLKTLVGQGRLYVQVKGFKYIDEDDHIEDNYNPAKQRKRSVNLRSKSYQSNVDTMSELSDNDGNAKLPPSVVANQDMSVDVVHGSSDNSVPVSDNEFTANVKVCNVSSPSVSGFSGSVYTDNQSLISTTSENDDLSVNPFTGADTYRSYVGLGIDPSDSSEEDDAELQAAIRNSFEDHHDMRKNTMDDETISSLLGKLAEKLHYTEFKDSSKFNINRMNVWDGAVRAFRRKSYSPLNRMYVRFTDDAGKDEGAVDTGGPRREFLRLLLVYLRDSFIFDGPENEKVLSLHSLAIREDLYYLAGKMIAVSLVHGGPGPSFFSRTLYYCLVYGLDEVKPDISNIADYDVKAQIFAIKNADSEESLNLAVEKADALITLSGAAHIMPTVETKEKLVDDLLRFYVINRTRSAFERFKDGLYTLDVLETVKAHSCIFQEVFTYTDTKLTSKYVEELFAVTISPEGSNKRTEELAVVSFWRDYLVDVEENEVEVTLKDIMVFATGLESIPPLGFIPSPSLEFLIGEDNNMNLPVANTCCNVLHIPVVKSYEIFKNSMEFGILNSPGFGRV